MSVDIVNYSPNALIITIAGADLNWHDAGSLSCDSNVFTRPKSLKMRTISNTGTDGSAFQYYKNNKSFAGTGMICSGSGQTIVDPVPTTLQYKLSVATDTLEIELGY